MSPDKHLTPDEIAWLKILYEAAQKETKTWERFTKRISRIPKSDDGKGTAYH